ncbi:hypothetical protein DSM2777_05955 [Obesumbacterium proteus]|nr:hypothetical protein DSM2777_05955 [Obesumbacterium proteus]
MNLAIVTISIGPNWAGVSMAFGAIMLFGNDFTPPDLQNQRAMLTANKIIVIVGRNIITSRLATRFSCRVGFLLIIAKCSKNLFLGIRR